MSSTSLPPDVVAAIQSGRTIQAVKLLRESTGLSLREAKEAVDRYALGQEAPRATSGPETFLPPDALEALRNGNKIEAIRLVREHSGIGLTEAKHLVDSASGNTGSPGSPVSSVSASPVEPKKSFPFLWIVIVLAVAAYVLYRLFGAP